MTSVGWEFNKVKLPAHRGGLRDALPVKLLPVRINDNLSIIILFGGIMELVVQKAQ